MARAAVRVRPHQVQIAEGAAQLQVLRVPARVRSSDSQRKGSSSSVLPSAASGSMPPLDGRLGRQIGVAVIGVLLPHPVGRQVQQAAQARLARAQRRLHGLQVGDVDQRGHHHQVAVRAGQRILAHQHPARLAVEQVAVLVLHRLVGGDRLVVELPDEFHLLGRQDHAVVVSDQLLAAATGELAERIVDVHVAMLAVLDRDRRGDRADQRVEELAALGQRALGLLLAADVAAHAAIAGELAARIEDGLAADHHPLAAGAVAHQQVPERTARQQRGHVLLACGLRLPLQVELEARLAEQFRLREAWSLPFAARRRRR